MKSKATQGTIRTIYEVTTIRRISGYDVAEVSRFDELERHAAEIEYQGACVRMGAEVGAEVAVLTGNESEIAGVLTRARVERSSYKVGNDFVSKSELIEAMDFGR